MLFQTCVTAHWAAAMAVLATVAALTLLLSARNTSLIWQKCTHWSFSKTALNVIQVFYSTGKKKIVFWSLYRLEPLANSTIIVFPSIERDGWRACRICSSWEASCWDLWVITGAAVFNLLPAFKHDYNNLFTHRTTCLRNVCLMLLTTMVESCRKAKPLLRCVCLSLIRRTFDGDKVANGAKADKMESREVWGPRFLRIRASGRTEGGKCSVRF